MAEIRNTSFNDGALTQAAFILDGSKPTNFTGLTNDSTLPDPVLSNLPHPDLGTSEDAPAAAFVKRLIRNASKDLDGAAQGADIGKKAKAGEQQGFRDQGSLAAKGKQEGQAGDRHGAGSALNRNGAGKDGHGPSGFPPKQGNTAASKGRSDANQSAPGNGGNNTPANQGGAGLNANTFGSRQLASQQMDQAAAGNAPKGAMPMPGAALMRAGGATQPTATAHATAGAASQSAAAPQRLFSWQRPGNTSKRQASSDAGKSAVGDAADDGAEDSIGEILAAGIERRMPQAPVTGKQTSDPDANDGGDTSDGSNALGKDRAAADANNTRVGLKRKASEAPELVAKKPRYFVSAMGFSGAEFTPVPHGQMKMFTNFAGHASQASADTASDKPGSTTKMKEILGQIGKSIPPEAGKDPRFPGLKNQLNLLQKYLQEQEKNRASSDKPDGTPDGMEEHRNYDPDAGADSDPVDWGDSNNNSYVSTADPKLAAALATGDVFEIVYAIMDVMFAGAMENTRQRGMRVRELNSNQERIRSAQDQVRILDQGFKPGADGSTKLKDKKNGTSDADLEAQLKKTQDALNDIGWDPASYNGGQPLSKDTTKQSLDDLISNMDSSLTSYNNMNSLETNDLTREAQAAQAYLTGMNGILTKENQALNSIAGSLGR